MRALAELDIPSLPEIEDFTTVAGLAAGIMHSPIGMVSLTLDDRQVLLGTFGDELQETPVEDAFCAQTIASGGEPLVVSDAQSDPRFAHNPLVRDSPGIRYYAGIAINMDGQNVGTLCVMDFEPRQPPDHQQIEQLRKLANLASSLMEMHDGAQRQNEIDLARRRVDFGHSLALRAAPIASWMWDIESDQVSTDDILNEWVDLDLSGGTSMQHLLTIVHPDYKQHLLSALDKASREDVDFRYEFPVSVGENWLMVQGRVFERDANGRAVSIAGVFVDITETKRTEQTTRILLRELNHRVKNTLAILQSLATQTLKSAPSPEQFARAFSGRLQALAAAQTMLSDNKWHRVSVHSLVRTLVAPYAANLEENLEVAGEDVSVGPDECLGLSLVIHELATNAAWHGALSTEGGKVTVTMQVTGVKDQEILNIQWRESGGPPVRAHQAKRLGSVLIARGLQKILGSSVQTEFADTGVIARINFPHPQRGI